MQLSMPPMNWHDMAKAIFWYSCRASAKSAKPQKPCANPRYAATTKSCPCSHACRTPSSTKSSTPPAQNAASCWQPTSLKPRSPCRASNTSSTSASRASNAIPHGRKWSSFMSKKSPKPPPANAPAAAAASPQAYVSDCFQKKISTAAPNSPTQKSSAATSPPSSCVWHH